MKKPKIFETTFNKYSVISQIGQGGSGTVYKVKDQNSNIYALKLLSLSESSSDKIKRFKNETHFCQNSNHPNIVKVEDNGFYYEKNIKSLFYIMPFYEKTLRDLIENDIEPENVLILFSEILNGVEAAHLKNIYHRDLKPENILLNPDRNEIVIADFGIARFNKEELLTSVETKPRTRLANFQYAAPEQRERDSVVNHKADIFALGLILNEMFTKKIPHGEGYKKIQNIASQYAYLDELVTEMINQSPEKRPDSIEEIKIKLKTKQNEYFSLQRIDSLKNEVVPIGQLGDEITFNPVELIRVDTDHIYLIFELNQYVNEKWIRMFQTIDDRLHGLYHAFPEQMRIENNKIYVNCAGEASHILSSAQLITDKVKQYIIKANSKYKEHLANERHQQEQQLINAQKEKQRQKQENIEREERRLQILGSIKI